MSDFFGIFWHTCQPPSPALLDAWLKAAGQREEWRGTAHRLDKAIVVAPKQAIADNARGAVLFSGELRNSSELARGAGLPPDSPPAQIVLALLEKISWEDILGRLNGPFAIAYYDRHCGQLHLVRDQLGQRFLFHTALESVCCTLFSDALPRLATMPRIDRTVDDAALADYFSLGYIPAPRTIYRDIAKVAPGTEVLFDVTKPMRTRRYWLPAFLPKQVVSWQEAREESRRLMEQAIRRLLDLHPHADFMLSGGIDSGTVMGLVNSLAPDNERKAYCIAFAENAYDESELAAGTASRCGVPLQVKRLAPAAIQNLDTLIAEAGEPFADSSLLPCAAATRETTQNALFTGDGGDEVFGGYRRYQAMLLRGRIPNWLQILARPACRIATKLLPNPQDNRSRLANLVRSLNSLGLPPLAAYGSFQQVASRDRRDELMAQTNGQNYLEDWKQLAELVHCDNPVLRYNALDLMVYLPDDGFRKTSLAAAGTGIQYLSPILDMDVVRFALSLPLEYRFNAHEGKRLLRELGRDFLDPRILSQPKRGFGIPVADWFRNELRGTILEMAQELPSWDKLQLLDYKHVMNIVDEHVRGRASHGPLLWALYCLHLWEKGF